MAPFSGWGMAKFQNFAENVFDKNSQNQLTRVRFAEYDTPRCHVSNMNHVTREKRVSDYKNFRRRSKSVY